MALPRGVVSLKGDASPMQVAQRSLGTVGSVERDFSSLAGMTMRMKTLEAHAWFGLLLLASSYLEWGTGGSTALAAWRAMQRDMPPLVRIDAVDSSGAWFEQLRTRCGAIRHAEAAGYLRLHLGQLGSVGEWGMPVRWSSRPLALRVSQARSYVERLGGRDCCYDLIMVDGRFREACALHALRLAHNSTTVVLHDSMRYLPDKGGHHSGNASRGSMHPHAMHPAISLDIIISQFYDVVLRLDTLAVMRPKAHALVSARTGDARFREIYGRLMNETRDESNYKRRRGYPTAVTR